MVTGEDPDYIDQLADRIEVENLPDNEHTQSLFRYFFKKWLVAMVVAWVTLKVVNQMILIFVGKGGIFKTTFFHMLLPPQLRQYFLNDSTGAYTDKDFMEAFSSKALLCLDEFEMVCISPLQRPHYFTSSYTYLFSKKVILLSFLG